MKAPQAPQQSFSGTAPEAQGKQVEKHGLNGENREAITSRRLEPPELTHASKGPEIFLPVEVADGKAWLGHGRGRYLRCFGVCREFRT